MKKHFFISVVSLFVCFMQVGAQKLERMNWINEPTSWTIDSPNQMTMQITPKSDLWCFLPHWFSINDVPFYYGEYGGDFEVKVNITGEYKAKYDQMGLMLYINEKNWIKAGIEYVNDVQHVSAVVTHKKSDWSIIGLKDAPESIWIKAVKVEDGVSLYYSFDNNEFTLFRTSWIEEHALIKVGVMGASPEGKGFKAIFKDFQVKHLPNKQRLEWAAKQK